MGMVRRLIVTACVCCAACVTGCAGPEPAARPESVPPVPPVRPTLSAQTKPSAPTPTFEYFPYHVRQGDTLYSLGQRFRVAWEDIARDNDIDHPEDMPVGTLLLIPKAPGVAAPPLDRPERQPVARSGSARTSVPASRLNGGKPAAKYWWPTAGRLVRRYGAPVRGLPEHGIAIAAPAGTEVYAVADGTVVTSVVPDDTVGAWGNVVAVAHAGGVVSWYAHLDSVLVRKGRKVRKGEPIGSVGATGAVAGSQLAFRLYKNNRPVNPEDYLP